MKHGSRWKQMVGILSVLVILAGSIPSVSSFASQTETSQEAMTESVAEGDQQSSEGEKSEKETASDASTESVSNQESDQSENDSNQETAEVDTEAEAASESKDQTKSEQTSNEDAEDTTSVSNEEKKDTSSAQSDNEYNNSSNDVSNSNSAGEEIIESSEERKTESVSTQKQNEETASSDQSPTNESTLSESDVVIYNGDDTISENGITLDEEASKIILKAVVNKAGNSYSYDWKLAYEDENKEGQTPQGAELSGADTDELTISSVAGKEGGLYKLTLTVTDADNHKAVKEISLKVYTPVSANAEMKKIEAGKENTSAIQDNSIYCSDTLQVVLSGDDASSETEKEKFSFEWQKKTKNGEFAAIENAVGDCFEVNAEGTYRVIVSRASDSDNYRLAYKWTSDEISAEKLPVRIDWISQEKTYDGKDSFSYSGKGSVVRLDSGTTVKTIEFDEDIILTLPEENAGTYSVTIGTDVFGKDTIDANIYDFDESRSVVSLTVNPVKIGVSVTVSGKNFDNTTDIKETEIVYDWDLDGTSLSQDSMSLLLGKQMLSVSDLSYSDVGSVDSTVTVNVVLKDENKDKEYSVAVNGNENNNYSVSVTLEDAVINPVNMETEDVVSVESGCYDEENQTFWVKGEQGTVVLRAKNGYEIASDLNEDNTGFVGSDATIEATAGSDGTVCYARNDAGEIAKILLSNVKSDNEAPSVLKEDVKLFGSERYTNKYTVTDSGSGVKAVHVKVSDQEEDVSYDESNSDWETVTLEKIDTNKNEKFSFNVDVPKYGYVYIHTIDQVGNETVYQSHILVYEKNKPAVPVVTCEDADTITNSKNAVMLHAEDSGEKDSGIEYIGLKLLTEDGQEVTDAVFALADGADLKVENSNVLRKESPKTLGDIASYKSMDAVVSISGKNLSGSYGLEVAAVDYCGNKNTVVKELVFDTVAPEVEVSLTGGLTYGSHVYYNAKEGDLKVNFSDDNLSQGGTYEVTLSGQGDASDIKKTLSEVTGQNGCLTFSNEEIMTLGDGTISVSVNAVDIAGNHASADEGSLTSNPAELMNNNTVEFVLDTTAPVLNSSVTTTSKNPKVSNYKNRKVIHYSKTFATTVTVNEANIDVNNESYLKAEYTSQNGENIGNIEKTASADGAIVTFNGIGKGSYGQLKITVTDLAGNVLVMGSNIHAESYYKGYLKQDGWSIDNGTATTDYSREIDTSTPAITVKYTGVDSNRMINYGDGNIKTYYKDNITVALTLDKMNEEDLTGMSYYVEKDGVIGEEQPIYGTNVSIDLPEEDAEYRILIKGVNRAGSSAVITEISPDGKKIVGTYYSSEDTASSMKCILVRDTVAPQAVVTLTPDEAVSNKTLNSTYGNRYYFNGAHTMNVTVNDRNMAIDGMSGIPNAAGHVKVSCAEGKPDQKSADGKDNNKGYKNSSEVSFSVADFKESIDGTYDADTKTAQFSVTYSTDGIRQYMVSGEDLAGNPVVYTTQTAIDTSFAEAGENRQTPFVTYPVVTDTIAPIGYLQISTVESEKETSIYEMDTDGWVYVSNPYSSEKSAVIKGYLKEDCAERTPYRIDYKQHTTADSSEEGTQIPVNEGDFGVDTDAQTIELTVAGPKVFWVDQLQIEDLAGNVSSAARGTHKIYLDSTAPSIEDFSADSTPPAIALYPEQNADKYGKDGTPLFKDDIKFHVSVVEPGMPEGDSEPNTGSAGLKSVTYELVDLSKKDKDGNYNVLESGVLYTFSGDTSADGTTPDGKENLVTDETKFVYAFDDQISISKDYNYNSLRLVVKAFDNVDNDAREEALFGIDTTAPVMKLSYNNNDAANGKYFASKDGRLATITVEERNFDKDAIDISVTASGNGSNVDNAGGASDPDYWKYDVDRWQFTAAGTGNGDQDLWTYTISFQDDGLYKLNITSKEGGNNVITDRAGNSGELEVADGTKAPFEFVLDRTAPNVSVIMGRTAPDEEDGKYYYRADNCKITVCFDDNGQNLDVEGNQFSVAISDGDTDDLDKAHWSFKTGDGTICTTAVKEYSADELAGDSRLLQDGSHTITVTAIDAAGNRATQVTSADTQYNSKSAGCIFEKGSGSQNPKGSFVLDTVAPKVTEIETIGAENRLDQNYPITDDKVYTDTCSVYYNKNVNVRLKVEDEHMRKGHFTGTMRSDGETDENASIKASLTEEEGVLYALYSLKDDHAFSGLKLTGCDKAGNKLVLDSSYKHNVVSDVDSLEQTQEDTVSASYGKIIDHHSPTVNMTYRSEDYSNMYSGETEGKETAYYNKPIDVNIVYEDDNKLDGAKLWAGIEGNEAKQSAASGEQKYSIPTMKVTEEGRYTFTGYGTDRALNPALVSEMIPLTATDEASGNIDERFEKEVMAGAFGSNLADPQEAFVPAYEIVLDQTAPMFKLSIASDKSTRKNLNSQGNRYYFNNAYTATYTVTDTNYDVERIVVKRGAVTSGKYNSEIKTVTSYDTTISCDEKKSNVFSDTENINGIYRYMIYGSDKAGNALIPSVNTNLDGTDTKVVLTKDEKAIGSEENTANLTVHVVVDTVKPQGGLTISRGAKTYYKMETDGSVSLAEPYRKETKATISFNVDDDVERSPVNIAYKISSTISEGKKNYSNNTYKYNLGIKENQDGKQIFRITEYVLTDMAGNVTKCSSQNKIYLDEDHPVIDELAPTISVVAKAKAGTRDAKGQPLFKTDVPLEIKVSDPDAKRSSSGLADITYQMYINDKLVKGDDVKLHEKNTQTHDKKYVDEALKYTIEKTVTVKAKSHNYNNLHVVVTAYDNAGRSTKKDYYFGIDTTSPKIDVSYDNNNAANGKYFKANRTATVKVTERNFNPSQFKISTQGAASISSWTHSSGKKGDKANGDDDTWTCKVTYSADGNYTFGVSGEDMLGHGASVNYSGAVPREFVIDKTAPTVSVTYNTNAAANGKYYNVHRTATISVNDVNFNGQHNINVSASGGGKAPGVSFRGKSTTLPFTVDGVYSINGTVTDMAGNVSRTNINEPEFVIDTVKPEIKIDGVKDLSSNRNPLNIILKITDTNPTPGGFNPELHGTRRGMIDISDFGTKEFVTGGVQYKLDTIKIDDYYTLKFKGVDLAGNETEMSISFSENQNGTTFEFAPKGVDNPEKIVGNSTNLKFKPSFILHDVDVVTVLSVQMNGKEVPYTYKGNRVTINDELDNDGMYSFTISTRDAAGHNNTMSPIEFRIDRTKPLISQDGLENGVKYYVDAFDITFRHDNPEDHFSMIEVNGIKYQEGDYVLNPDGSVTIHVDEYQPYQINVQVSDAAGNNSELTTFEFELTRNIFIRWYKNKPVFVISLAVVAGVLAWFFLILWKRRKDEDEEGAKA